MAKDTSKLDKLVQEARRNSEKRAQGHHGPDSDSNYLLYPATDFEQCAGSG